MRYYPAVGPAIPHTRADHSRVTHPFAGHLRLPQGALDLHVLSTPPAFVLSQDQTLQEEKFNVARDSPLSRRSATVRPNHRNVRLTLPSAPNRRRINESASHIQ
jgi:hypothetical protein